MKRIFNGTDIFPDWLDFCCFFFFLIHYGRTDRAIPSSETLCISCQEHNTGLSELMVSPNLKILHISACLLPET